MICVDEAMGEVEMMIQKKLFSLLLLSAIFLGLLGGCAGKTVPFIPDLIPAQSSAMARIIVSREAQIAGARWALDLIDVGESIEPNGMISYRFSGSNHFIRLEDVPRSHLSRDIFNDFFWRNPQMIHSVYCGNGDTVCEKSYDGGLYHGDIGLIWKTGVAIGWTNRTVTEIWQDGKPLSEQLDPVMRVFKKILGLDEEISLPPQPVQDLFFPLFNRNQIYSLIEVLRTNGLEHSLIKEEINLGILGTYKGNKEGLQVFKSGKADADIVLTSTVPYFLVRDPKDPYPPHTVEGEIPKEFFLIDNRFVSRNVQEIGKLRTGDTVIWDRKPGLMRLALVWYDGSDIMPQDIMVEPGKTYFIHYTLRQPKTARWELIKVE